MERRTSDYWVYNIAVFKMEVGSGGMSPSLAIAVMCVAILRVDVSIWSGLARV